ncbi:MAG: ATP-binding cassette domain-containing protein [Chloroflexi bacterium]|nr:ATP-binding cassette domain-containing protein [Chloroflexota bacterium]
MPTNQRFFVPEVVQTSEMDCGPASLKALLEGFGVSASYGRLREACQTEVDGTSINTIEQIAIQLGLDAEQIMIPADHLLLAEANALPALVVVRLPNGLTHFVIVWSQHGRFVQVMDPGIGRRWVDEKRLLAELYIHRFPVSAQAFRDWAGTEGFLAPLRLRLGELQLTDARIAELVAQAVADPGWRGLATLDAATRMVASLVRANGLPRGEIATQVLTRFFDDARRTNLEIYPTDQSIPAPFWFAEPLPRDPAKPDGESERRLAESSLLLRGAVLVHVRGTILKPPEALVEKKLSPELAAALQETPLHPEKELWRAVRQDGLFLLSALILALFVAALGVTVEALLLQGVMKLGLSLPESGARMIAIAILFALVLFLFALELPLTVIEQRIGRRLETRLRILLLEKIPRLSDRYFHSRLTSDMTMRAHGLRALRTLPTLAVSVLRLAFQLLFTALGVIILDPVSAPWAIAFTLVFGVLAYFSNIIQREREMRLFTHDGALSRFYLDALLGLIPVRMHGAERSMRREHETLLTEWTRASRDTWRIVVVLQGIGAALYAAFSVIILLNFVTRGGQTSNILLLFYWTLNLPALAQSMFALLEQYPIARNHTLRLLEPLGAPDETDFGLRISDLGTDLPKSEIRNPKLYVGVGITMDNIAIQAGGHTILSDINLQIKPGEHVAIVGPSGAGKSSLVGILLGWHKPVEGRCLIDSAPLDGERLRALRRETAWVDPAVQLWNRSLIANLQYGNQNGDNSIGNTLEAADLFGILERLPEGMQTALGESGGLVSGGEGQRVRLGRAMNKPDVRLAILDEPFRGLDRAKRSALLMQARARWRGATMFCITHDVAETQAFARVLVIENGRIVEDAAPAVLAAQPASRYRAMLDAEEAVRRGLWESADWRRLWIEEGELRENALTERR